MVKVLLVDDEPDLKFTTRKILERGGYEVSECSNGKECLSCLKEMKPDIILLDIMMPGLSGWEIGREIKEDPKTRQIPLIIFTIRDSIEDKERSFKYSKADAHITKPFSKQHLVDTIEKVLGK